MAQPQQRRLSRRKVLVGLISAAGAYGFGWPEIVPNLAAAESDGALDVAYAGSMGSVMEGPIQELVRAHFHAGWHGRPQGSTGLARLIAARVIRPDVFVSATASPMRIVLGAGRAQRALPIASTEMVLAYSPHSLFASALRAATTNGHKLWWEILATPGLRFGRTDPATDPQGRNIVFTMELAQQYYRQPELVQRILGAVINERQIFPEPSLMARLQSGELDAASAYKTQPEALGLPYLSLPPQINLGAAGFGRHYASVSLTLDEKTYRPEPLVFYAAALQDAPHPDLAARFVDWLAGAEGRAVLQRYHYDPPRVSAPLRR